MAGEINFSRCKIKATVAPKVFKVTKENTFDGSRLKLVRLSSGSVGITHAPEGAKVIIGRMVAIKRKCWCGEVESLCRKDVMKIHSRVKGFYPK